MSAGIAEGEWHVTGLQPDLEVCATRPMPELAPAVEAQVAAVWARESALRPRLFNGTVFSADAIAAGRIEGHWTEYRRVLAQLRTPELAATLGIRSLAVNGLLQCADGFVLGRRDPASVYQPGRWHSPPAGSVDRRPGSGGDGLDLAAQVVAECEEELGMHADEVVVLRPVLAIEHPGSHVVDVGMLLRTSLDFTRIEAAWNSHGNREYDGLHLLTPAAARIDAELRMLDLLPPTLALIDAALNQAVRRI